ncbi:MAG: PAS domain S-box protein [Candidatus Hodarchaeota archaeon]
MTSIEKILINSEKYIRKLFDGIPIPIYVWQRYDNDFILVDCNDTANKDLKEKTKVKIGVRATVFYKDNPKVIQALNKCFIKQKNISREIDYNDESTQQLRSLNIRYSFITPELVLMHIEDITEKKLAKQKFITSEIKLKQLNKELEQKVKDRTKELEESETNYRDLIDNLDVGFYQVTLDGHMINHNLAHKTILGYSPSDSLKDRDVRAFWQFPEQRDEYLKILLKNNFVKDYICHSLTKDDKKIIVQLNSHVIRDKEGNPIRIDGTFKDITEKYRLEQALKESEEKYRLISENANDLIGILNQEFKYEYINEETFLHVLGYSKIDLIGKSALDYLHPKDITRAAKKLMEGFEKGEGSDEVRFKHKKGHWVWIDAKGTTFLDKDGELKALIISRDINERKIAAQKLRESEEKYRFISENAKDLISVLNSKLRFEYINEEVHKRLMGYDKDDLMNQTALELIHPDDREKTLQAFKNVVKIGEIFEEVRIKHKDGHYIWTGNTGSFYSDKDGKTKFLIISRDITERKKAEQLLKESEEKFRIIAEQSFIAIAIMQDFTIKYANQGLSDISGYSNDEILNWSPREFFNFIYSEDCEKVIEVAEKKYKGIIDAIKNFQFRVLNKNGKISWVEIFSKTIHYKGKEADLVSIMDITEKKLAEERLKESEANYRAMTELLPDIIYEADLNLTITYVNKIGFEKFGYTPEDLKRGVNIKNLISSEYAEKALSSIQSIFKGNITEPTEYLMVRKDGTKFYARVHSRPVIKNDKVVGLRGTVTDINEMVIAEQIIKDSEIKYRHLFDTTPYSVILFDPNGNIIDCNLTTEKLFGYEKKELVNKNFIELSIFPLDQLPELIDRQKRLFQGEVPEPIDFQVNKRDGTLIWAHAINSLIEIAGQKSVQVIIQDITAKKEAEQKLKESEQLYREAFNRASFYKDLFAHDINNILQIMNSSAELISLQLNNSDQIEDIENIANIIKKQVSRGTKLVNNVRILSELEESEISIQPTQACDILLKSIEYVKKAYNDRNINLEIKCPDDEIYVIANELLQDVFENILINAIKYNENPSIEILINIFRWTHEKNSYYKFEFIDNGIGIQDERKRLIFERRNGEYRSDKGMGLGLSLVSKIINYYHGKIWIENRVKGDYSKGSKFIIILPESNIT